MPSLKGMQLDLMLTLNNPELGKQMLSMSHFP